MKRAILFTFLLSQLGFAQAPPSTPSANPFQPLAFLLGTWEAKTIDTPGVKASGIYTFQLELKNHLLARHSENSAGCKGPADFDCTHGDLLYVYAGGAEGSLRAIYFDNEGHVIQYAVKTPTPTTAEFVSDAQSAGPQFRLLYELKGGVMFGKFQIRMPGQDGWKSYLEWSGTAARTNTGN